MFDWLVSEPLSIRPAHLMYEQKALLVFRPPPTAAFVSILGCLQESQ